MSRLLAALLPFCCLAAACATIKPKPYLLTGDAESAEVGFAGDPVTTLPLARAHCAAYEKAPRLLQTQENIAYYQCYRP